MIYEYKCGMCDTQFEAQRKMDDRHNPIECDECKSMDTRLVMSAPKFKTSGGGHSGSWDGKGVMK